MSLTLGYWKARGVTHSIRMLMYYLKLEWEDVTFNKIEEWQADKAEKFAKGGEEAPFANIPYLIDGDFILTESGAIPLYLCQRENRGDLLGKDLKDQSRVRQVDGVVRDFYQTITGVFFKPDRDEKLKEAAKEDSKTLALAKKLSDYLGEKEFFVGYLTYSDFLFVQYFLFTRNAFICTGAGDPFTKFPNLIALAKRVLALPELEGFEESGHCFDYFPDGMFEFFKEQPLP